MAGAVAGIPAVCIVGTGAAAGTDAAAALNGGEIVSGAACSGVGGREGGSVAASGVA